MKLPYVFKSYVNSTPVQKLLNNSSQAFYSFLEKYGSILSLSMLE